MCGNAVTSNNFVFCYMLRGYFVIAYLHFSRCFCQELYNAVCVTVKRFKIRSRFFSLDFYAACDCFQRQSNLIVNNRFACCFYCLFMLCRVKHVDKKYRGNIKQCKCCVNFFTQTVFLPLVGIPQRCYGFFVV